MYLSLLSASLCQSVSPVVMVTLHIVLAAVGASRFAVVLDLHRTRRNVPTTAYVSHFFFSMRFCIVKSMSIVS